MISRGTAPQYYFGHGLSYTTYSYSNLQVAGVDEDTLEVTVSVDVQNTGDIDGEEVVQLYVGFDNTKVADSIGRPKKELKAFDRVALSAGEKKTVTLTIDPEDLTYWNAESRQDDSRKNGVSALCWSFIRSGRPF